MGKRSDFPRMPRDLYKTWDARAYPPLLRVLGAGVRFVEPCAADMTMVDKLEAAGHECVFASDAAPLHPEVIQKNAFSLGSGDCAGADYIITNPPWRRDLLHGMIEHFRQLRPTWLLFDAAWSHTIQEDLAKKHDVKTVPELMEYCAAQVSVGRLKWIPNSKHDGTEDTCWYLFLPDKCETRFIARAAA